MAKIPVLRRLTHMWPLGPNLSFYDLTALYDLTVLEETSGGQYVEQIIVVLHLVHLFPLIDGRRRRYEEEWGETKFSRHYFQLAQHLLQFSAIHAICAVLVQKPVGKISSGFYFYSPILINWFKIHKLVKIDWLNVDWKRNLLIVLSQIELFCRQITGGKT